MIHIQTDTTKVLLVKALVFPVVMYGCEILNCKETWAPKNWCFWNEVLEITLESPLDSKEIKPISSKRNQSWIFIGRTDAETLILWPPDAKNWKRFWCWKRFKVGGEGDDRGWDDWMTSPIWWTWVWASSGSRWWTGNPGVLQSIVSQRVKCNWVSELNWTHIDEGIRKLFYLDSGNKLRWIKYTLLKRKLAFSIFHLWQFFCPSIFQSGNINYLS